MRQARTWEDAESRRGGEDAEHERRGDSSPAHLSVEAFRTAERERVGRILQEMVTEAEDMGLYDIEPLPFRR
jgi:hypothetical protein